VENCNNDAARSRHPAILLPPPHAGQARYRRWQALVGPVFGVLKEQPGMRRLRLRGLTKAATEVALYCTAFNLTRLWRSTAKR